MKASIEAPPTILELKQQNKSSTKVDIKKAFAKADTKAKVEFDYIIQVLLSKVA